MRSGTLGKTANCQIGVSVQLVTDTASLAANWRLFCPESWDDTTIDDPATAEQVRVRRRRAGIPDTVRHCEKWLALSQWIVVSFVWVRAGSLSSTTSTLAWSWTVRTVGGQGRADLESV